MDGRQPLGYITNTCNRRKRPNREGFNNDENNHGTLLP
jgi:hypothetical protein